MGASKRLTKTQRNQIKTTRRDFKYTPEPRETQRVLATIKQEQKVGR